LPLVPNVIIKNGLTLLKLFCFGRFFVGLLFLRPIGAIIIRNLAVVAVVVIAVFRVLRLYFTSFNTTPWSCSRVCLKAASLVTPGLATRITPSILGARAAGIELIGGRRELMADRGGGDEDAEAEA
jgi:hypothetical protein